MPVIVRGTLTHRELLALASKDKRRTSWIRKDYFKHHSGHSLNNGMIQYGTALAERARQLWKSQHDAVELAIARLKDDTDAALLRSRNLEKYGDPVGPPFEWLKDSARDKGLTERGQFEAVIQWALRPDLYEYKSTGSLDRARLMRLQPEAKILDRAIAKRLSKSVSWASTGNPKDPLMAKVGPKTWVIQINDFPDEPLYSLIEDGRPVAAFDDWPKSWNRP